MNRKTTSKKQAEGEQQVQDALGMDSNLETVRDILFGKQLRETKNKDAELEKLIKTSVETLKKEVKAEFKAMNQALEKLRRDVEKAAEKSAQDVASEFEDTRAAIKDLETATSKSQTELYDTLDTARLALEKDAREWNEALGKELDQIHAKLKDEKADRTVLAALFSNLARELAGSDNEK